MTDHVQVELFYLGEEREPVGGLVMVFGDHDFSCHVSFSTPAGGHLYGESTVHMRDSIADWTQFTFVGNDAHTRGTKDGAWIRVGEDLTKHEGTVLPSYAATAFVLEWLLRGENEVTFQWLDESHGTARAVSPAVLVRAGLEDVDSPVSGPMPACERVELTVDGTRTNTYWVRGGVIVATDWNGARSFALPQGSADNLRAALSTSLSR